MDGWRMSFHLGRPIFRGYVSFREGNLLLPFFGERRIISYLWPPPNLHLTPVFLNSKHSKWSSWGILEIDTERSNTSLKFLKGNAWFGKPRHCWYGLHHLPPDFRRWDDRTVGPWRKYLVEHIERSSVWSIRNPTLVNLECVMKGSQFCGQPCLPLADVYEVVSSKTTVLSVFIMYIQVSQWHPPLICEFFVVVAVIAVAALMLLLLYTCSLQLQFFDFYRPLCMTRLLDALPHLSRGPSELNRNLFRISGLNKTPMEWISIIQDGTHVHYKVGKHIEKRKLSWTQHACWVSCIDCLIFMALPHIAGKNLSNPSWK